MALSSIIGLGDRHEDLFDMACLACDAALELDNLVRAKESNLSSFYRLRDVLSRQLAAAGSSIEERCMNVSFPLWYAMTQGQPKDERRDVESHYLELRLLVGELRDVEILPVERIEMLRDLCVELSRRYAAEQPPYMDRLVA
jgi:hypothetical protein